MCGGPATSGSLSFHRVIPQRRPERSQDGAGGDRTGLRRWTRASAGRIDTTAPSANPRADIPAFDRPALAAGTHLTAGPKAPDRTIDIEIHQSYCDLEFEFLVS